MRKPNSRVTGKREFYRVRTAGHTLADQNRDTIKEALRAQKEIANCNPDASEENKDYWQKQYENSVIHRVIESTQVLYPPSSPVAVHYRSGSPITALCGNDEASHVVEDWGITDCIACFAKREEMEEK